MLSLRWSALVCFGLFTLTAANLSASEKHWLEIRSTHFSVITDAGEKRGVEVARRCEQMRAAFSVLMDRATTHDPAPLLILALDSEKEVDKATQHADIKLRHSGIFLPAVDQDFILFDASGDPWHAFFHEYAHELLYANTSSAVLTWFEEGFAEYFSTLEVRQGQVELGMVPIGELQFLRQNGKLMRLADLIRVDQNSELYTRNGPAQAMFYAESWLLVHYLFDYQMIDRAEPFFAMLAAGLPVDQATQKAFGVNSSNLEQNLLAYAEGEQFRYFSLPAVPKLETIDVRVQPISAVTASALLAQVRWQTQKEHSKTEVQSYIARYESLLQSDPDNVAALRGLGLALLETHDYEQGVRRLLQAEELEPDNAINHCATALAWDAVESAGASRDRAAFKAQDEARECIRLDPDFADAYRLLAAALVREGDFDGGIEMMQRAIVLSPRSQSYQLDLASIELRKHDYGPAVALLNELKNSRDPAIAKQAEYFLTSDLLKQSSLTVQ